MSASPASVAQSGLVNRHHFLDHRVPPLLVAIVAAICMRTALFVSPQFRVAWAGSALVAAALGVVGVGVVSFGVLAFRRHRTTLDPLRSLQGTRTPVALSEAVEGRP